ncbi:MAG TPA: hypothetical protein ENJ60_05065 [Aeromonadales bacterium]|nr:hypothetical protein [Aeromonadales bacterium]
MKNLFRKSLKTVAAISAILVLSSQSVFASANVDTAANSVDGVVTVYATLGDSFYVEAGKFNREYRQQLKKLLSDRNVLNNEFSETLEMIGVEAETLVINTTGLVTRFSQDMAE